MTTDPDPDDETFRSRRGVLAAVATTAVGGCLATTATTGGGDATGDRQTTAATETRTNTTERPTTTTTPLPTVTGTPDQTAYPVDHPNERTDRDYGPLLTRDSGAVRPVRSRAVWDRLVETAPSAPAEGFADYEFVERTDFDDETLVVLEQRYSGGPRVRLRAVAGLGTPHLRLRARKVGRSVLNEIQRKYLIVRLPTDGTEIERITATVTSVTDPLRANARFDEKLWYYVYRDGTAARRPSRARRPPGDGREGVTRRD